MSPGGANAAPVAEPTVTPPTRAPTLDAESREWLQSLRTDSTREEAIARLHPLLLRTARFEVVRRRPTLPHLRGDELDEETN